MSCIMFFNFNRVYIDHLCPSGRMFGLVISHRCRSSKSSLRYVKNEIKSGNIVSNKMSPRSDQAKASSKILKPAIFALMFSSASFAGAAIWQYENMRNRAKELIRSPQKWLVDKVNPSNLWIREKFGNNFRIRAEKQGSIRQVCNTLWNSLSEAQKIFVPILLVNVLVYLAWKVPSIRPTMMTYFVLNPASQRICWPMFLSTFSHSSLLHLLANMFALNSFITGRCGTARCGVRGLADPTRPDRRRPPSQPIRPNNSNAIVPNLGKEQFVAFYCSAATVSSLVSHLFKVALRDAAMSLGASGAIMAVLGYTCVKYPDTLLSVVFIPFFAFKASTGIKTIMAVDVTCMLMRFRFFDHAAHLGGASFGIFWCLWGNEHIWQRRGPLLEYWHKLRSSAGKS